MNAILATSLVILGGVAACCGAYVLNALPAVPTADILSTLTMQHVQATAIMFTGAISLCVGVMIVR